MRKRTRARWSRLRKWLSWWLSEEWERAWLFAAQNDIVKYLVTRARERDGLFHKIEDAIRAKNYAQAIELAERGWQLSGR